MDVSFLLETTVYAREMTNISSHCITIKLTFKNIYKYINFSQKEKMGANITEGFPGAK